MPRKYGTKSEDQAVSSDKIPAEAMQAETMSLLELNSFIADGAQLTFKQATEYASRNRQTVKNAIAAHPEIFNGNVRTIQIGGLDMPASVYIAKSALDTWIAQRDQNANAGNRKPRGNARKYIVMLPDAQLDALNTFLASIGVDAATKAFKGKAKDASEDTSDDSTPAPVTASTNGTVEMELVEA